MALAPKPNPHFGIDFIHGISPDGNQPYANSQARYEKAKATGATFTRWPMYWHRIEPSRDYFDYSSQDEVVIQDLANGFQVDAILLGTPSWGGVSTLAQQPSIPLEVGRKLFGANYVRAFGAGSAQAVPVGLELPPLINGSINPENRWAYFVYKTVKRYMPGGELAQQQGWPAGQGIRVWEMWNEPDFVWEQNGQQVPVFWEGGSTNYARLLKVGYLAAKAADPQATVVFGGLQYWSDEYFFSRVMDEILKDPQAAANNYYFDAVAYHLYVNPYHVYNVANIAKGEMAKRGISKAIWINETNNAVFDDPQVPDSPFCPEAGQGTMDEQASFVIQAYALGLAAGVDKLFIFQLYDDNVGYREYYGLVRNDGSTRPSYTAYQVAATYLTDILSATKQDLGNGVDSVTLLSSKHGRVTVLWNNSTSARTATLPATSPTATATLVTKDGSASYISAQNNVFSINLPPVAYYNLPGCPANGPSPQPGSPYILVEPISPALDSRVNPLPAIAPDTRFAVSWSRYDKLGGEVTYDVQYRVGRDGQWKDWLSNTTKTAAIFGPAQGAKTYYFRSRARLGNLYEPYPEGDGDTFTTVKLYLSGRVVDNRGRPVPQASVAAALPGVSATSTDTTDDQGEYRLELPDTGTYEVAVSKQGYGNLLPKAVGITTTMSYDFILPPKDNAVRNGDFEAGLEGWLTAGTVLTQTFRHTGNWGVTLSKNGTLTQTVTVPAGMQGPTLSFIYRSPKPGPADRFEVSVGGNNPLSYIFPLAQDVWQHGWLDLSGVQGQAVLLFRFTGEGDLWLDEVSLGSSQSSTPHRIYFPLVPRTYPGGE
jgi:hypothetical protein